MSQHSGPASPGPPTGACSAESHRATGRSLETCLATSARAVANLHYLRHGRTFILIATHGQHLFFEEEASVIRDIQRSPFKVGGYSVSHRNGHASVRIDQETYKRLKACLVDLAPRRSVDAMVEEFGMLRFEPYAPVRRQLPNLLRAVNRARKQAGFEPVPVESLRLKRRINRPFDDGL